MVGTGNIIPYRFRGMNVMVGQISRDIGVRFSSKTFVTHKIDPDVDEARRYLLEDLAYSQALEQFGLVRGVGPVPRDDPRLNLVGDPYFTDGYRAVMFFEARPTTLDEIRILLGWAAEEDAAHPHDRRMVRAELAVEQDRLLQRHLAVQRGGGAVRPAAREQEQQRGQQPRAPWG